jgi:hypothetical protein
MLAKSTSLEPGTELLLVTTSGVVLGRAVVERVSNCVDVIARLSLYSHRPHPDELRLLHDLSEAAESFSFAVMEELEAELARLGLRLMIPRIDVPISLGKEFDGIVITEQLGRIAFHLMIESADLPTPLR